MRSSKLLIFSTLSAAQVRLAVLITASFVLALVLGGVFFFMSPSYQDKLFFDVHQNTCEVYSVTPNSQRVTQWLPSYLEPGGGSHFVEDSDSQSGSWNGKDWVHVRQQFNISVSFRGVTFFYWEVVRGIELHRPDGC